jgi:hypothetical protein
VHNSPVSRALPSDFGLTDAAIEEIRARDRRQAGLFVRIVVGTLGTLWLTFTVLIYVYSARRAPLLGLVMAPLLAGLGAVIAGLPIAMVGGLLSWFVHPPHPMTAALERYEAASAGVRTCDVCRLAQGDATPREGVSYCGRCGAWICPECRRRYDRRAIAALKRAGAQGGGAGPREST